MWSRRVDADLTANRLTTTVRALQAAHRPIIDLTLSNPTRASLQYPTDLLEGLAATPGLIYRPEPFGLIEARRAVASDYLRRGVRVAAERIVLTASTSEAYSLLLKVLCDPNDEVLVPRPSYPLLDHLARLDAVRVRSYDLEYHGRWALDFESLERAWSDATRARDRGLPKQPDRILDHAQRARPAGRMVCVARRRDHRRRSVCRLPAVCGDRCRGGGGA